ncbi:MAG: glycosyltransferase family 4 protein [Acidobacteriota bacterium]
MAKSSKIRLLYVSSIDIRWMHLEWVCRTLDRERFELSFLLLSLSPRRPHLESVLEELGIPYRTVKCRLTPGGILGTIREVWRECRRRRAEVVHTHIFFASLVGLLGAFLARVPVRVNTRHHSMPNHGTPKIWLDRLANRLATCIIAPSEMLRRVLVDLEGVPSRKVRLMRLGIDLERFRDVPAALVREMSAKYNPAGDSPVVGVIARHIELKGIQYTIPAFARLLERYPKARLVLAFAVGPYHETLQKQLESLPADRYVQIPFEENVFALYKTFDVFVHVPIGDDQESFGLVFLEALAAGVPSIFTLSGIGPEILVHGRDAWLVEHRNSDRIHEGLLALLEDPGLRASLAREGWNTVYPAFSLSRMARSLEALYEEELGAR